MQRLIDARARDTPALYMDVNFFLVYGSKTHMNVFKHLAAWDAQHACEPVSSFPNSLNRPSMEVRKNCPFLTSHVP